MKYYDSKEFFKALPLLEELQGPTRGSAIAEDVQYYYAMTQLGTKDYYMGGYYLKNFAKNYPRNPHSEECLFQSAICSYNLSPSYTLDQVDTYSAINDFQFFLDRYPNSHYRDSANYMVGVLNEKLEKKDFEIATIYVKTEKYKAADQAIRKFLGDHPSSKYREEAMFLLIKCRYLYAQGSVDSKKIERFRSTTESYITFANAFPESKWLPDGESYYEKSRNQIEKLTKIKS